LIAFAIGVGLTVLVVVIAPRLTGLRNLPFLGSERSGTRLLVVGLDGADWNIIDPLLARGEMPNLARLMERGSRARLLSFQPMLSPVLWTTIATGVRPEKHGILDFVAINTETGEAIPVTSNLRKAPAFWNLVSEAGLRVGVTAWWATFPAETVRGYMVSDRIAYQLFGVEPDDEPAGKTYPAGLFEDVRGLVVDPASIDGQRLSAYLGPPTGRAPTAEEEEIEEQLRALIASGETYRRIAGDLALRFRPDVEVIYYQPTDTIAHLTMRYRLPLMPDVAPPLAARFGPALDAAYREADELLGEAVSRAGDAANIIVCSDHGFRSGANRPASTDSRIDRGRAADWHRKYGILVLAGPAIRRGVKIEDATLIDIAPTALALLGQPVPSTLQGRALQEAFEDDFLRDNPVREGPAAETPGPATASQIAGGDRQAVLEKLVSLGYLSPDSLNARNNRGILHMNRGEFSEAITQFEKALEQNPNQAGVLVNLGRCRWLAGDPASGRATLEEALRLNPKAKEAENLLGNIAMEENDFDRAERHFRRALEIEPDYTDAHNSLGILMEKQRRWEDAIAEYRRVIEVDPDYAEGYNNIGNIRKLLGKPAEAESWYQRAIEADPTFAGSYNNLALMLQERGDLDGAEELYRRALRLNPDEPRTHNNLGSLHYRRGEMNKALEEFRLAAELDESYAEARNSLGVVYGSLGRRAEEIEAYREALRLNPDYADARFNLGIALLREGDERGGRTELEKSIASNPRHVPSLVTLSGLVAQGGEPRKAVELARRAVSIRPAAPAPRLALGKALAAAGNAREARQQLRRALELDPGLNEARRALQELEAAQAGQGMTGPAP
jgi:tetratricopeptide (TPR) repeat protein